MRIVGPDGKVRLLTVVLIIMFLIMAIMCVASCKRGENMTTYSFAGAPMNENTVLQPEYRYKISVKGDFCYYTQEFPAINGNMISFKDEVSGKRLVLIGYSVKIQFLKKEDNDA